MFLSKTSYKLRVGNKIISQSIFVFKPYLSVVFYVKIVKIGMHSNGG